MMARVKKNITLDEKRRLERERKRKYREKLKNIPEKVAKVQEYDRNRYKINKEKGKTRLVADMSERKKRKQRKIWKAASLKYRQKKQTHDPIEIAAEGFTPPESPVQGQQDPMDDRRGSSNKKRLRRNRDREKRRIKQLEEKLKKEKQRSDKWERKFRRLKVKNEPKTSPSPNKAVSLLLKKGSDVVKRQLVFGVSLTKQLKKNASACRSQREKQIMAKLVTGGEITRKKLGIKLDKERIISRYYQRNMKKDPNRVRKEKKTHVKLINQQVVDFFENDENSCLAPGKRNFVTLKKVEKNKRYLLDSVKNLYKKFTQLTEFKISYASFLRLKPFWVVKKTLDSRDTCLCTLHSNFKFKLLKLNQLGITKENSTSEFLKSICCDITKMSCMYRQCGTCKDNLTNTLKIEPLEDYQTFYWKWLSKNETRTSKKRELIDVKVTVKEKIYCSAHELIEHVKEDLFRFTSHCYKVWHQQQSFKKIINSMASNEASVLMDWSENYVCKYNEEVQSVHFGASKSQISLHTGMIYISDSPNKKIPFCTVSNSMRHDAAAVWTHLVPIFSLLRDEHPLIDTVHFFSDGPTTQYKNKLNFFLLCKMSQDLGLKNASWNFSEPAHGKGPADGIGGLMKRTADKAVTFGNDIIDVKSFIDSTKKLNVRVFIVQEHDITAMDENIPVTIKPIPKTMMLRQITWTNTDCFSIGLRVLSCVDCRNKTRCCHYPSNPEKWNIVSKSNPRTCGQNENMQLPGTTNESLYVPANLDQPSTSRATTDICSRTRYHYEEVFSSSSSGSPSPCPNNDYEKDIEPGDFIVVQLHGKNNIVKHYIALVEYQDEEEIVVKYLRRKGKNKFVFPDVEDVASVGEDDICQVLQKPLLKRGHYIFKDSFENFSNTMF